MDSIPDQIPEPMTDAELRREARRKKILETAKSRLEKLNGRAPSHDDKSAEALEYSDPEVEPSVFVGGKVNQDEFFSASFFAATTGSSTSQDTPNTNIFVRSRAYIFISAVLGLVLSQFVNNCLFVPVGLCILIELFYFKGLNNSKNNIVDAIIPMALLFTGASLGNKIKQINSLISISHSLLINLAITIFCICLSSLLFQYISSNHIVEIK